MILPPVFPQRGIDSKHKPHRDGQQNGIEIDRNRIGDLAENDLADLLAHIHLLTQAEIALKNRFPIEKILD